MIKAVAFDLDGTLIDSTDAIVESLLHTFDILGQPHPPRGAIMDSMSCTLENQFAQLTHVDPGECVRIFRTHHASIVCEKTVPLPGAEESLQRLRDAGLRIGFATSKKREYAEMILKSMGLLGLFESRLGPYDVTHPKPHPEAVLQSLEGLRVTNEEMFFVGDTDFDVRAAQAADVRCLCVTTGYDSREKLEDLAPEAVLDTLLEVTDYILTHRNGHGACGGSP